MATVNINDLADWLNEQEQNTIDTPYSLNITGVTENNLSTLSSCLNRTNTTLYVDLSETVLPSVTALTNTFKNTNVVVAPTIPSTVTQMRGTFYNSCIKQFSIETNKIYWFEQTFYNCVYLEEASIITTATNVILDGTFKYCSNLKELVLKAENINTVSEVCEYTDSLENVVWHIPSGSLYYEFDGGNSYQTIKKMDIVNNFLGSRPASRNFGGSLSALEELKIKTSPTDASSTGYKISSNSTDSSIFGALPSLKKLEVEIDFANGTEGNLPNSIVNVNNNTSLKEAYITFKNINKMSNYSTALDFYGCTALETLYIFGIDKATFFKSTSMNILYNCSSLTNVVISKTNIEEADKWHLFSLKVGADNIQGKVYDQEGSSTISQTTINKTVIKLPVLTDELWFPDSNMTDQQIEDVVEDIVETGYGVFNRQVIPPNQKSFVMIADDPDHFITNLPMGGGGSGITVYDTEEELEEDLPNLSDGDIVGTYGDGEPTFNDAPLGSTMSYLGNTDPSDGKWLICDGRDTTGTAIELETHYPSLYMFLGGTNVLPEIFDHSRPSAWETITISTNSASPTTMQYDGVLNVNLDGSSEKKVFVNGVRVTSYTSTNLGITYTVEVKKGDVVYATGNIQGSCYAQWYKSHKIIKATSYVDYYHAPASEIAQIEQYFDNGIDTVKNNGLSYSTTETLTGGKWIDGKPIYRKVFKITSAISGATWGWGGLSSSIFADVDTLIECKATLVENGGNTYSVCCYARKSAGFLIQSTSAPANSYFIAEYTKTTD